MVLLPLAALLVNASSIGWAGLWTTITIPANLWALELTVGVSAIVVVVNALFGTLIAWVLVRDSFWGKPLVNSVIDLPFALPTIVAGLTLLALYGPGSPVHIDVSYSRTGIALALLFVTLPFVTRAVQPVLITLDRDMEEAAAVLGANGWSIFRKIVLPNLAPALLAGAGLAFARALGEFGAVTLIAGNNPLQGTQVMSLVIYGDITSYDFSDAAALSLVLLALSLVVLLAFNRLSTVLSGHHDV
jgi:sulfate/thiosulfate transport system permease protein